MSNIKDTIGTAAFEQVRASLKPLHPSGTISDDNVEQAVIAAWANYRPEYATIGIPPKPQQPGLSDQLTQKFEAQTLLAAPTDALKYPIYIGHGHHHRMKASMSNLPFQSEFTIQIPYVRVPLPAKLSGNPQVDMYKTVVGEVRLSSDHLLGSIDQITEKYGDAAHLGYAPARVDLVTTPRYSGSRYAGALAIYLGYRNAGDKVPSFYLLEGGMATGEPKMIFFAKTMDVTIKAVANYQVTPFANKNNIYTGKVTMSASDPNEPDTLTIRATAQGQTDPYIQVDNRLERVTNLKPQIGALDFYESGLRIALIAKAMGINVYGVPSPIQNAMAAAGSQFDWQVKPKIN